MPISLIFSDEDNYGFLQAAKPPQAQRCGAGGRRPDRSRQRRLKGRANSEPRSIAAASLLAAGPSYLLHDKYSGRNLKNEVVDLLLLAENGVAILVIHACRVACGDENLPSNIGTNTSF